MDQETTLSLVEKASAGDSEAFGALFERHRARFRLLICSRLGQGLAASVDPDDILQESALRALGSMPSFEFQGEESFLRWLGGIAENVILDLSRKRRRSFYLGRDVAESYPSPGRAERRNERFERLQDALADLNPDYREVIRLARIEGLSIRVVADRMGRSPNAVSILLLRALRKLRERFGDTESLHLPDRRLDERGAEK